MAWPQQRLRDHGRRVSQQSPPGRPTVAPEVSERIQTRWQANPTWGSSRIVGELRKLGIDAANSTVENYRPPPQKPPSLAWKAFLHNHVQALVALDCGIVPTVTHPGLFVLVMLAHQRRHIIHVHITEHPTAEWTTQQVIDAFPWDEAPRDLLRDRDRIYGTSFRQRGQHLGIEDVLSAPGVRGSTLLSSGSSGASVASAWIT
jgi:putative transposase